METVPGQDTMLPIWCSSAITLGTQSRMRRISSDGVCSKRTKMNWPLWRCPRLHLPPLTLLSAWIIHYRNGGRNREVPYSPPLHAPLLHSLFHLLNKSRWIWFMNIQPLKEKGMMPPAQPMLLLEKIWPHHFCLAHRSLKGPGK